jgi:hypothetical protein
MERGTFRPDNGDSIRIDTNGDILDGQHRLAAIVRVGKPVNVLVASGVDRETFATIDVGKRRNVNDIIGIDMRQHGVNAPKGSTASARLLLEYESGFKTGTASSTKGERQRQHPVDAVRSVCHRPGFIDAVCRASKFAREMVVVTTAPSAVAMIACELDNKAAADAYFDRLLTMEGLHRNAPEHTVYRSLRMWRDTASGLQRSSYGQLFALIRGYIASRDGETLSFIRLPKTAETFPYLPTR